MGPFIASKKPRSDTPLRILVVNCQSIKNKKQELDNLVETSKPDIMIGTESWLSNDIAIKIKRCISECIVTIYTCDG
jgi:hypothetical protein